MASSQQPEQAAQLLLPTQSPGWNGIQTLKSRLLGRLARFTPRGVPRSRPRKSQNDAIIFEVDLYDAIRANPMVVGLQEDDYGEMNEMALELLHSLNSMVNLETCRDICLAIDMPKIPTRSAEGHEFATIGKEFERLHELIDFLVALEASPSPLAAQFQFNLTTGQYPLFTLPPGDTGTLAIGRLRKWKAFLDRLMNGNELSGGPLVDSLDATQFLDREVDGDQLEKRASIMVKSIFQEFEDLSCAQKATHELRLHELRLHVSDEIYAEGPPCNLDMFISCCPDETLIWQEAECGSFPVMDDVVKRNICESIRKAIEQRKKLHILVKPQGLFDITDKIRAVCLPSDNFDGESLSELFRQGVFSGIKPHDYLNGTAESKAGSKAKAQVALGLSRCLMDFFDEGLDLASHSWIPDNIHFRHPFGSYGKSNRRLYVSLRPKSSETEASDLANMFKSGNPVLLSFARLLLEVLSGEKIPMMIHPNDEENLSNWLELGSIVQNLDAEESYSEYMRVVEGCLGLWKRLKTFEDRTNLSATRKAVREAIYEEIVQKLELIANPRTFKRKRRDSTIEGPPVKKKAALLSGLNPSTTSMGSERGSNFPAGGPITTNEDVRLSPTLGDFDSGYGELSLYDEQDEEHASNRRKSKEYFDHLSAVTKRYIEPLEKFPTLHLPPKQRNPIKVAIIDSGIDMLDPVIASMAGKIQGKRNWCDHDPNNYHDTYGHGTQVARLLLRVAPAVEVYVAKVSNGRNIEEKDLDRIAKAIEWATIVWKVDMISLSLGLDGEHENMKRSLDKILDPQPGGAKKIVIAAAANWGGNHAIAFPARHKGVLCIHSTDGYGNPSLSNPTVEKGTNFAVLGLSIKTSVRAKVRENSNFDTGSACEWPREVAYISGTSYATAIAAGIAANVLEFARFNPSLSEGEREMLYSSWGMRSLFKAMGESRKEHHYVHPWKLFDGRDKREVWRHIQDVLRGQR